MRYGFILLLVLTSFFAHSQELDTVRNQVGEIRDAEIVVRKSREVNIQKQSRKLFPAETESVAFPQLELTFDKEVPDIELPGFDPTIKTPDVSIPGNDETYKSELTLGFGNFVSPLVSLKHRNKLDEHDYGVSFFHESFLNGPVRDQSSGSAVYNVNGSYARSLGENLWQTSLGYHRNEFYFFGLSEDAFNNGDPFITGRSNWTTLAANSSLTGSYKKVRFGLKPGFSKVSYGENQGDNFGRETNFGLEGSFTYAFDENNRFNFSTINQFSNYNRLGATRSLISLNPEYRTSISIIDIALGFQLNFIDDISIDSYSQIGAVMSLELPLVASWRLKAGIGNEVQQNRLHEINKMNPFLFDSLDLQTSIINVPFHARIQGNVIKAVKVHGGVRIEDQDNALYFVPGFQDSSRFVLQYDSGELSVFEYFFGFVYEPNPDFRVSTSFSIFENSAGSEVAAWYRPTSTLKVRLEKQIDKFSIQGYLELVDGLNAPLPDGTAIEMDAVIDTGATLNYSITEQFNVFSSFRNLLNKNYEYYLNYPSRSLEAKVGLSYTF